MQFDEWSAMVGALRRRHRAVEVFDGAGVEVAGGGGVGVVGFGECGEAAEGI